jgi:mono/diheme cytochrome c family protein
VGRLQRVLVVVAAGVAATGLGACANLGDGEGEADLVAGKQLFVERCGSCHQLSRAETQGTAGPDLDAAFRVALQSGMDEGGVRGVVRQQILFPARLPRDHPA